MNGVFIERGTEYWGVLKVEPRSRSAYAAVSRVGERSQIHNKRLHLPPY